MSIDYKKIDEAVDCLLEKIVETLEGQNIDISFDATGKALFAVISHMSIIDQIDAIDWTIENFKRLRTMIKKEFH